MTGAPPADGREARPELPDAVPPAGPGRAPLYPRLLGLHHLTLRGWQRALLGEGAVAAALLLVAADVATAWTILVLPLAVAVVVKLNDVVAGALASTTPAPGGPLPRSAA